MRDDAWRITLRNQPWYRRAASWTQHVVSRATPDWLKSLSKRLITAAIAIPIVLGISWYGGWAAFGGAVLILGLGIYELHTMFHKLGYRPLTLFSFSFGVALFLAALPLAAPYRSLVVEAVISLLVLGSLSWLLLTRHAPGTALMDWALTLVMSLYLAWPISYLLALRGMVVGTGSPRFWWMVVVFLGVWAFDSGAYFAGRFFGAHALAPAISPGKTWEGVVGGSLLALASVFVFTRFITPPIAWYHVVALGILISFAATIGDLAESLIKRQANVKDSGNFFRGHGGVLDRIDSLLFAIVVVYFYTALLGLI